MRLSGQHGADTVLPPVAGGAVVGPVVAAGGAAGATPVGGALAGLRSEDGRPPPSPWPCTCPGVASIGTTSPFRIGNARAVILINVPSALSFG